MVKHKRAILPYQTSYTRTFEKSWERYNRAGRYDMHDVIAAMNLVTSRLPLPAFYLDHALKGHYQGYRELHVGGDYLLVYKVDDSQHLIIFTDFGTHSELFD